MPTVDRKLPIIGVADKVGFVNKMENKFGNAFRDILKLWEAMSRHKIKH